MVPGRGGSPDEARRRPQQPDPRPKGAGGGGNTGGSKGRRKRHDGGRRDPSNLQTKTVQRKATEPVETRGFRGGEWVDLSPAGQAVSSGTRVFGVPHGARILVLSEDGVLGFAARNLAARILQAWRGNSDARLVGVVGARPRPSTRRACA